MLYIPCYTHTFLPPSLFFNLHLSLFYIPSLPPFLTFPPPSLLSILPVLLGVGMYVQTLDDHRRQIGSLRFTKEKGNDEGLFRKNQCVSNRTSFQSYAVSEGVSFLDGWMDGWMYLYMMIYVYLPIHVLVCSLDCLFSFYFSPPSPPSFFPLLPMLVTCSKTSSIFVKLTGLHEEKPKKRPRSSPTLITPPTICPPWGDKGKEGFHCRHKEKRVVLLLLHHLVEVITVITEIVVDCIVVFLYP